MFWSGEAVLSNSLGIELFNDWEEPPDSMAGWCRLEKRIRELIKIDVRYPKKWNFWPHEVHISLVKVRVVWPPQRVKYFSFRPSSMCLGLVLANEHMIQNYAHINWMRGNVNWKTASPCFAFIENGHMLPTRQRYAPQVVIRKSLIGYMLHTAVSTACEISKTFLGFQTR